MGSAGDVSGPEPWELERALKHREKEFRVVNDIIALINRPADLPSNLARALHIARDALGTHILILSLLDGEGKLSCTAWACEPELEDEVLAYCRSRVDEPLLRQALQTRMVVQLRNIEQVELSAAQREAYRRLDVRRLAFDPLLSKGQILGALTLMRHNAPYIDAHKISFLHEIKELIVVLIENANLQSQIRELSIIKERQRLARELHDSVTQSLFTLSLAAQGLKAALEEVPGPHQQAVDLLIDQTQAVQRDMRSLIEELRPVELQEPRLEPELRRHVKSLQRTRGIAARLEIKGDVRGLSHSLQRHINRIAQEALSNVAQHSGAGKAHVTLEVASDCVTLTVRDDGVGFDLKGMTLWESDSLGLLSMRERAEMVGGALLVRTAPGAGTTITARLPISKQEER
ncbi:MAG TPA: GAF domain-containing sensor histidine kinase [Candidatus Sulfomarinibacteraceae bacterium]|nr:GAF domain-containing sensor histidine kinase [Candidatus Sulfomarinibacteraceae bacterium]